ncbi:MAG TPA: DUF3048 domain-containing protein, partial [Mycobacteriales bacterium]|nr:DUF3048 domain-containing protein [Mycobacteriales bacterium]
MPTPAAARVARSGRWGVRSGSVLVALVLVAACSGDPAPVATPSPTTASPTPTPTPTPTKAPPPRPAPVVNPLTGLPGLPKHPVLAVKIDDTASGRPQLGLEYADLVYVEQVEAGATRLLAVFASRQPAVVGPVRSVRNSDPELLAAYGHPALAYSGGAGAPVATLRRSRVADAGAQRFGGSYRRLGTRSAPYNLVVNLSRLAGADPALLADLTDAARRVALARRFYNDAVRDTRLLRRRRMPRLLRLGGA